MYFSRAGENVKRKEAVGHARCIENNPRKTKMDGLERWRRRGGTAVVSVVEEDEEVSITLLF